MIDGMGKENSINVWATVHPDVDQAGLQQAAAEIKGGLDTSAETRENNRAAASSAEEMRKSYVGVAAAVKSAQPHLERLKRNEGTRNKGGDEKSQKLVKELDILTKKVTDLTSGSGEIDLAMGEEVLKDLVDLETRANKLASNIGTRAHDSFGQIFAQAKQALPTLRVSAQVDNVAVSQQAVSRAQARTQAQLSARPVEMRVLVKADMSSAQSSQRLMMSDWKDYYSKKDKLRQVDTSKDRAQIAEAATLYGVTQKKMNQFGGWEHKPAVPKPERRRVTSYDYLTQRELQLDLEANKTAIQTRETVERNQNRDVFRRSRHRLSGVTSKMGMLEQERVRLEANTLGLPEAERQDRIAENRLSMNRLAQERARLVAPPTSTKESPERLIRIGSGGDSLFYGAPELSSLHVSRTGRQKAEGLTPQQVIQEQAHADALRRVRSDLEQGRAVSEGFQKNNKIEAVGVETPIRLDLQQDMLSDPAGFISDMRALPPEQPRAIGLMRRIGLKTHGLSSNESTAKLKEKEIGDEHGNFFDMELLPDSAIAQQFLERTPDTVETELSKARLRKTQEAIRQGKKNPTQRISISSQDVGWALDKLHGDDFASMMQELYGSLRDRDIWVIPSIEHLRKNMHEGAVHKHSLGSDLGLEDASRAMSEITNMIRPGADKPSDEVQSGEKQKRQSRALAKVSSAIKRQAAAVEAGHMDPRTAADGFRAWQGKTDKKTGTPNQDFVDEFLSIFTAGGTETESHRDMGYLREYFSGEKDLSGLFERDDSGRVAAAHWNLKDKTTSSLIQDGKGQMVRKGSLRRAGGAGRAIPAYAQRLAGIALKIAEVTQRPDSIKKEKLLRALEQARFRAMITPQEMVLPRSHAESIDISRIASAEDTSQAGSGAYGDATRADNSRVAVAKYTPAQVLSISRDYTSSARRFAGMYGITSRYEGTGRGQVRSPEKIYQSFMDARRGGSSIISAIEHFRNKGAIVETGTERKARKVREFNNMSPLQRRRLKQAQDAADKAAREKAQGSEMVRLEQAEQEAREKTQKSLSKQDEYQTETLLRRSADIAGVEHDKSFTELYGGFITGDETFDGNLQNLTTRGEYRLPERVKDPRTERSWQIWKIQKPVREQQEIIREAKKKGYGSERLKLLHKKLAELQEKALAKRPMTSLASVNRAETQSLYQLSNTADTPFVMSSSTGEQTVYQSPHHYMLARAWDAPEGEQENLERLKKARDEAAKKLASVRSNTEGVSEEQQQLRNDLSKDVSVAEANLKEADKGLAGAQENLTEAQKEGSGATQSQIRALELEVARQIKASNAAIRKARSLRDDLALAHPELGKALRDSQAAKGEYDSAVERQKFRRESQQLVTGTAEKPIHSTAQASIRNFKQARLAAAAGLAGPIDWGSQPAQPVFDLLIPALDAKFNSTVPRTRENPNKLGEMTTELDSRGNVVTWGDHLRGISGGLGNTTISYGFPASTQVGVITLEYLNALKYDDSLGKGMLRTDMAMNGSTLARVVQGDGGGDANRAGAAVHRALNEVREQAFKQNPQLESQWEEISKFREQLGDSPSPQAREELLSRTRDFYSGLGIDIDAVEGQIRDQEKAKKSAHSSMVDRITRGQQLFLQRRFDRPLSTYTRVAGDTVLDKVRHYRDSWETGAERRFAEHAREWNNAPESRQDRLRAEFEQQEKAHRAQRGRDLSKDERKVLSFLDLEHKYEAEKDALLKNSGLDPESNYTSQWVDRQNQLDREGRSGVTPERYRGVQKLDEEARKDFNKKRRNLQGIKAARDKAALEVEELLKPKSEQNETGHAEVAQTLEELSAKKERKRLEEREKRRRSGDREAREEARRAKSRGSKKPKIPTPEVAAPKVKATQEPKRDPKTIDVEPVKVEGVQTETAPQPAPPQPVQADTAAQDARRAELEREERARAVIMGAESARVEKENQERREREARGQAHRRAQRQAREQVAREQAEQQAQQRAERQAQNHRRVIRQAEQGLAAKDLEAEQAQNRRRVVGQADMLAEARRARGEIPVAPKPVPTETASPEFESRIREPEQGYKRGSVFVPGNSPTTVITPTGKTAEIVAARTLPRTTTLPDAHSIDRAVANIGSLLGILESPYSSMMRPTSGFRGTFSVTPRVPRGSRTRTRTGFSPESRRLARLGNWIANLHAHKTSTGSTEGFEQQLLEGNHLGRHPEPRAGFNTANNWVRDFYTHKDSGKDPAEFTRIDPTPEEQQAKARKQAQEKRRRDLTTLLWIAGTNRGARPQVPPVGAQSAREGVSKRGLVDRSQLGEFFPGTDNLNLITGGARNTSLRNIARNGIAYRQNLEQVQANTRRMAGINRSRGDLASVSTADVTSIPSASRDTYEDFRAKQEREQQAQEREQAPKKPVQRIKDWWQSRKAEPSARLRRSLTNEQQYAGILLQPQASSTKPAGLVQAQVQARLAAAEFGAVFARETAGNWGVLTHAGVPVKAVTEARVTEQAQSVGTPQTSSGFYRRVAGSIEPETYAPKTHAPKSEAPKSQTPKSQTPKATPVNQYGWDGKSRATRTEEEQAAVGQARQLRKPSASKLRNQARNAATVVTGSGGTGGTGTGDAGGDNKGDKHRLFNGKNTWVNFNDFIREEVFDDLSRNATTNLPEFHRGLRDEISRTVGATSEQYAYKGKVAGERAGEEIARKQFRESPDNIQSNAEFRRMRQLQNADALRGAIKKISAAVGVMRSDLMDTGKNFDQESTLQRMTRVSGMSERQLAGMEDGFIRRMHGYAEQLRQTPELSEFISADAKRYTEDRKARRSETALEQNILKGDTTYSTKGFREAEQLSKGRQTQFLYSQLAEKISAARGEFVDPTKLLMGTHGNNSSLAGTMSDISKLGLKDLAAMSQEATGRLADLATEVNEGRMGLEAARRKAQDLIQSERSDYAQNDSEHYARRRDFARERDDILYGKGRNYLDFQRDEAAYRVKRSDWETSGADPATKPEATHRTYYGDIRADFMYGENTSGENPDLIPRSPQEAQQMIRERAENRVMRARAARSAVVAGVVNMGAFAGGVALESLGGMIWQSGQDSAQAQRMLLRAAEVQGAQTGSGVFDPRWQLSARGKLGSLTEINNRAAARLGSSRSEAAGLTTQLLDGGAKSISQVRQELEGLIRVSENTGAALGDIAMTLEGLSSIGIQDGAEMLSRYAGQRKLSLGELNAAAERAGASSHFRFTGLKEREHIVAGMALAGDGMQLSQYAHVAARQAEGYAKLGASSVMSGEEPPKEGLAGFFQGAVDGVKNLSDVKTATQEFHTTIENLMQILGPTAALLLSLGVALLKVTNGVLETVNAVPVLSEALGGLLGAVIALSALGKAGAILKGMKFGEFAREVGKGTPLVKRLGDYLKRLDGDGKTAGKGIGSFTSSIIHLVGWLGKLMSFKNIWDGLGNLGRGAGGLIGRGVAKAGGSKLGRAASSTLGRTAAGGAARAAGGALLGKLAGGAAAAGAGGALAGAGGTLAAILPPVAAALAIGGIGYGAYRLVRSRRDEHAKNENKTEDEFYNSQVDGLFQMLSKPSYRRLSAGLSGLPSGKSLSKDQQAAEYARILSGREDANLIAHGQSPEAVKKQLEGLIESGKEGFDELAEKIQNVREKLDLMGSGLEAADVASQRTRDMTEIELREKDRNNVLTKVGFRKPAKTDADIELEAHVAASKTYRDSVQESLRKAGWSEAEFKANDQQGYVQYKNTVHQNDTKTVELEQRAIQTATEKARLENSSEQVTVRRLEGERKILETQSQSLNEAAARLETLRVTQNSTADLSKIEDEILRTAQQRVDLERQILDAKINQTIEMSKHAQMWGIMQGGESLGGLGNGFSFDKIVSGEMTIGELTENKGQLMPFLNAIKADAESVLENSTDENERAAAKVRIDQVEAMFKAGADEYDRHLTQFHRDTAEISRKAKLNPNNSQFLKPEDANRLQTEAYSKLSKSLEPLIEGLNKAGEAFNQSVEQATAGFATGVDNSGTPAVGPISPGNFTTDRVRNLGLGTVSKQVDRSLEAWCADFVSKFYQNMGIEMKYNANARYLYEQMKGMGWEKVKITNKDQIRAGDAVFWKGAGYGRVSGMHVEVGLGNGKVMGTNTSPNVTDKNMYDIGNAWVMRAPSSPYSSSRQQAQSNRDSNPATPSSAANQTGTQGGNNQPLIDPNTRGVASLNDQIMEERQRDLDRWMYQEWQQKERANQASMEGRHAESERTAGHGASNARDEERRRYTQSAANRREAAVRMYENERMVVAQNHGVSLDANGKPVRGQMPQVSWDRYQADLRTAEQRHQNTLKSIDYTLQQNKDSSWQQDVRYKVSSINEFGPTTERSAQQEISVLKAELGSAEGQRQKQTNRSAYDELERDLRRREYELQELRRNSGYWRSDTGRQLGASTSQTLIRGTGATNSAEQLAESSLRNTSITDADLHAIGINKDGSIRAGTDLDLQNRKHIWSNQDGTGFLSRLSELEARWLAEDQVNYQNPGNIDRGRRFDESNALLSDAQNMVRASITEWNKNQTGPKLTSAQIDLIVAKETEAVWSRVRENYKALESQKYTFEDFEEEMGFMRNRFFGGGATQTESTRSLFRSIGRSDELTEAQKRSLGIDNEGNAINGTVAGVMQDAAVLEVVTGGQIAGILTELRYDQELHADEPWKINWAKPAGDTRAILANAEAYFEEKIMPAARAAGVDEGALNHLRAKILTELQKTVNEVEKSILDLADALRKTSRSILEFSASLGRTVIKDANENAAQEQFIEIQRGYAPDSKAYRDAEDNVTFAKIKDEEEWILEKANQYAVEMSLEMGGLSNAIRTDYAESYVRRLSEATNPEGTALLMSDEAVNKMRFEILQPLKETEKQFLKLAIAAGRTADELTRTNSVLAGTNNIRTSLYNPELAGVERTRIETQGSVAGIRTNTHQEYGDARERFLEHDATQIWGVMSTKQSLTPEGYVPVLREEDREELSKYFDENNQWIRDPDEETNTLNWGTFLEKLFMATDARLITESGRLQERQAVIGEAGALAQIVQSLSDSTNGFSFLSEIIQDPTRSAGARVLERAAAVRTSTAALESSQGFDNLLEGNEILDRSRFSNRFVMSLADNPGDSELVTELQKNLLEIRRLEGLMAASETQAGKQFFADKLVSLNAANAEMLEIIKSNLNLTEEDLLDPEISRGLAEFMRTLFGSWTGQLLETVNAANAEIDLLMRDAGEAISRSFDRNKRTGDILVAADTYYRAQADYLGERLTLAAKRPHEQALMKLAGETGGSTLEDGINALSSYRLNPEMLSEGARAALQDALATESAYGITPQEILSMSAKDLIDRFGAEQAEILNSLRRAVLDLGEEITGVFAERLFSRQFASQSQERDLAREHFGSMFGSKGVLIGKEQESLENYVRNIQELMETDLGKANYQQLASELDKTELQIEALNYKMQAVWTDYWRSLVQGVEEGLREGVTNSLVEGMREALGVVTLEDIRRENELEGMRAGIDTIQAQHELAKRNVSELEERLKGTGLSKEVRDSLQQELSRQRSRVYDTQDSSIAAKDQYDWESKQEQTYEDKLTLIWTDAVDKMTGNFISRSTDMLYDTFVGNGLEALMESIGLSKEEPEIKLDSTEFNEATRNFITEQSTLLADTKTNTDEAQRLFNDSNQLFQSSVGRFEGAVEKLAVRTESSDGLAGAGLGAELISTVADDVMSSVTSITDALGFGRTLAELMPTSDQGTDETVKTAFGMGTLSELQDGGLKTTGRTVNTSALFSSTMSARERTVRKGLASGVGTLASAIPMPKTDNKLLDYGLGVGKTVAVGAAANMLATGTASGAMTAGLGAAGGPIGIAVGAGLLLLNNVMTNIKKEQEWHRSNQYQDKFRALDNFGLKQGQYLEGMKWQPQVNVNVASPLSSASAQREIGMQIHLQARSESISKGVGM